MRIKNNPNRIVPTQNHGLAQVLATFALTAVAFLTTTCVPSLTCADEYQVSLDQGSVITVEVTNESLIWTNVLENGDLTKQTIPFANIKQLVLSKAPASKQVSDIRKFLNMLESEDYLERELAEEQLSLPAVGGRFRSLVKIRDKHENYEVRYRIERILNRLDESSQESSSEFDLLVLKDGTRLEGDAGEFTLNSSFRGTVSSFERKAIRLISSPVAAKKVTVKNSPIQVRMFHSHENEYFKPEQVLVDFEYAPNGAELTRAATVNDVFIPLGIRMDTEQIGYIGISGYPFKFPDKPVSGKSICVFETVGTYAKRFKGVTELKFCMPNQASVPAGVREIGMFIARVNHSRDFLLEAYNADDELLASVESTDEPCVFAGVKSNELITKIRILSNPHLFRVDRSIDEDYGIDSICFSPPVPVSNTSDAEPGTIRLRNGDLLKGKNITADGNDGFSIDLGDGTQIRLGLDELQTIRFNTQADGKLTKEEKAELQKDTQKTVTKATENFWMAVLKDRSTIRVEPGKSFNGTTFNNLSFKPDDLLALKSSKNPTRFPEATDFEKAKRVIVFPTCRIATDNLEFTDSGFNWNKDVINVLDDGRAELALGVKLQQPVHTGEDEDEDEDPSPPFTNIEYAKSGPDSTPTVWFNAPQNRAYGTGRLRMTDGQQLTLNGDTGFAISKLDKSSVTISVEGKEFQIPLEKILSIEFPAAK